MRTQVFLGILIPFLGTVFGSACVLFMKNELKPLLQRALIGFAAGVMLAASIWSLLLPAMEQSAFMGQWAFVPAAVGFWIGILLLMLLDWTLPHLGVNSGKAAKAGSSRRKTIMLVLAVTLHNLPEGMAVGVVYAGWLSKDAGITGMDVLALSLGIAIQNFPEGAIISLPLRAEGAGKGKAFVYGALSGVVEPMGAALTILAACYVVPLLPYLLSFAAGAMVYVVVEDMIPDMSEGEAFNVRAVLFAAGFTVMMALDVVLG